MIIDKVFGELEYDYLWEGNDKLYIFGKEYDIKLFVYGEEDEEITDIQREAYISFCDNKDVLSEQMEQAIFEYYQSENKEYRNMYGDKADEYAPVISDKSGLVGLIKPQSISVADTDDQREINILFKSKWNIEYGVGIKLINEKIVIVGVQADVL